MIALIVFLAFVVLEVTFFILQRKNSEGAERKQSLAWLASSALFLFALMTPLLDWSFAYLGVVLVFLYKTIRASLFLWKGKGAKRKKIGLLIVKIALYLMIVLPLALFPGKKELNTSDQYGIISETYTWTDESRDEEFTAEADHRQVTVQFWYPETADETYPVIVFSHGAFGYRMSNYSTFMELASNGYIVCSIDHPYHSFMTKQTDGKTIIVDMDFMKSAMATENGEISGEDLYALERVWMKLRTEDMHFVLDTISEKTTDSHPLGVFNYIQTDSIGVIGHSMGGATAAAIGRDRQDVDAVIVLDGTMMGETLSYEDGKESFIDTPYPKPILNVFNEEHFAQAQESGSLYPNTYMHQNSENSYQVVVNGSGHLNFTDLPLVSPVLAGLLGTGSVDPAYCMETTNALVLEFFDTFLKGENQEIAKQRVF